MSNASDFVIEDGILKKYVGAGGSVVIPNGVKSIGQGAFRDCKSLVDVVVPEGVVKIYPDAFNACDGLTSIHLPSSLDKIGANAFRMCSMLTQLDIVDVRTWCAVTMANEYSHPLYESGFGFGKYGRAQHRSGSLFLNRECISDLIIPEGVKEIIQPAFENCVNICSVTIPLSLCKIAGDTFYGCKELKAVYIKDLQHWNSITFQSGSDSFYVSGDGTSNPLYYGAALMINEEMSSELILPSNLKEIGDYTFSGCSSLKSVTIQEGVTKIGKGAFSNCHNLKSISIPKSLKKIECCAFEDCHTLNAVRLDDLAAWLQLDMSYDSNPLNNNANLIVKGEVIHELTVPDGVTSINDYAFEGCSSLTKVTIPLSVTSIGSSAFEKCIKLTSVRIPESVTSIGSFAFEKCIKLTSVRIPESVTSIGSSAFEECIKLTSVNIPSSVSHIGDSSYKGCKGLTKLFLTGNQEIKPGYSYSSSWSNPPFQGCEFEITVPEWTSNITRLLTYAKLKAIHTERISAVPAGLRVLAALGFAMEEKKDLSTPRASEHMAFLKKHAPKQYKLMMDYPPAIYFLCEQELLPAIAVDEYIMEATERNNTELKALLLSYQDKLGQATLSKVRAKKEKRKEDYQDALVERMAERDPAKGIEELTFVITGKMRWWNSKKEIQEHLEAHKAKISSSVTKQTDYLVTNDMSSNSGKEYKAKEYGAQVISEDEFNEMVGRRFKDATQIIIPPWLKIIQDRAFSNCKSLTSITIPEGITSIGKDAFAFCENLTSIALPQSLKSIGFSAFYCCRKLKEIHITDLKSWCEIDFSSNPLEFGGTLYLNGEEIHDLIIPKGVKKITARAFDHFLGLTSVVIPEGVKSIGSDAFSWCENLGEVIIPSSMKQVDHAAFFCCHKLKAVYISDLKAWCDIVFAPFGANPLSYAKTLYLNGEQVRDLVIPDGVTSIGDCAFLDCNSLMSVSIPESVTDIGAAAFYGCTGLMDKDGFVIVKNNLFDYKGSGGDITIPASVTGISAQAFSRCRSLINVTVPESVIKIGKSAFSWCSSLIDVTIPSSVTSLGRSIFNGCSALKSMTIPESVTCIEDYAFYDCDALTSITIPKSVTNIGNYAFWNCKSLTNVEIPSSVVKIGEETFEKCKKLRIHAAAGSYAEQYAKENKIPFVADTAGQ